MIKFVPDHLKTKNIVSMQLKIPYLLRYVPDQHKKKMCDKAVDTSLIVRQ